MSEQTTTPVPEQSNRAANSRVTRGLAVVVVCLLLSGVAHGFLDGRWAARGDLAEQGARLVELPDTCGDWRVEAHSELAPGAQAILRCHGSLVRNYVNDTTGDRVTVAVLFGPRGPIAVHTPEVCYSSVGTQQIDERVAETIDAGDTEHRLWSVQFSRGSDPKPALDVWYGWSDGGPWVASEHPRFWMTESLYKIQVAGDIAGSGSGCRDFLTSFLPQVNQTVGGQ